MASQPNEVRVKNEPVCDVSSGSDNQSKTNKSAEIDVKQTYIQGNYIKSRFLYVFYITRCLFLSYLAVF